MIYKAQSLRLNPEDVGYLRELQKAFPALGISQIVGAALYAFGRLDGLTQLSCINRHATGNHPQAAITKRRGFTNR